MDITLVVKVIEFEKLIPALQNGEVDVVISNIHNSFIYAIW